MLATSIAGTAAALWTAAALAALGRPPSHVATAVALAFLPYAGLFLWDPRPRRWQPALAMAAGTIAVGTRVFRAAE